MNPRAAAESGTTLLELLLAMALTLVVTGAVFSLVTHASETSMTQPASIDMQQRARVGADMLVRDLVSAGSGVDSGPSSGSLVAYVAPVVPRRIGLTNSDVATVARDDAISLINVPATAVQSTSSAAYVPATAQLHVSPAAGCAVGKPACGIVAGTDLLLLDALGHGDVFRATQVAGGVAQLAHHAPDTSFAYGTAAIVAEAATHVYYLDAVHAQLRHYDGYQTDSPAIDNVVSLSFAYFGDPNPPAAPKPPIGTANCLYDASGTPLPMPTLAGGGSLVPLPLTMFQDGPWCGIGRSQFDADLLRVRMVRVTLRVQAASASLRGVGAAFANSGVSHGSYQSLPDGVFTFDVAPPNLRLGK